MSIDTQALFLSLKLAFFTLLFLIPFGVWAAYQLARLKRGKSLAEAALALPLVLPPTVLGYYLLISFTQFELFNQTLTFSFMGLVIASIIFNLPFAIQPIQRAFESIPQDIKEAAQCSGLSPWQSFQLIELPLAWRGMISAAVMTFAHTLGEFGVILMIGGSIPGETKTIAISIYDSVQNMDHASASGMSLLLLMISLIAITWSYQLTGKKRVT
jgi:molybdate transport system permease protein